MVYPVVPDGYGRLEEGTPEYVKMLEKTRQHYPYDDRGLISPDDLTFAANHLKSKPWRFAKTRAKTNPHWYCLREHWQGPGEGDEVYNRVLRLIRNHGETVTFFGMPWRVLKINGMGYWSFYSASVEEVNVLNRRPFEDRAAYDPIAGGYDAAFSDPESLRENAEAFAMLGDVSGGRVLDIGCGTGLLLDYNAPEHYVGIDPSGPMLAKLKEKHPDFAGRVLQCKLEEFAPTRGLYDTVACMFGSVAYIDPLYVENIPNLVVPGGRWFVMFLAGDYEPVTYERTGIRMPQRNGVFANLPGTQTRLGQFIIVEGRRE